VPTAGEHTAININYLFLLIIFVPPERGNCINATIGLRARADSVQQHGAPRADVVRAGIDTLPPSQKVG
jgi:hypothetical protein